MGKPTGVYASELTVPYYAFLDAGMDVDVASPNGGVIPVDPQSLRAPLRTGACDRFLADANFRAKVTESLAIADVDIDDYDIVYLAGGNTYHFLHHLRVSGLLEAVGRFASRGGVVAGLSAGALILTPHIGLAGYPAWDRDENRIGLSGRGCRGLGLTRFEFFPHYRRSARYRDALLDYSRRSRLPVYACPDGSGSGSWWCSSLCAPAPSFPVASAPPTPVPS